MIKINYLDNGITKVEEVVKAGTKIQRVLSSTTDLRNHNLFSCGEWCSQPYPRTPVNPTIPTMPKIPTIQPVPNGMSSLDAMFGGIDWLSLFSEIVIITIVLMLFAIVIGMSYRWLKLKVIQNGVKRHEN